MIHHVFPWCFPYAIAVPLGHTIDNEILIYNQNCVTNKSLIDTYLCAWGSSGGYKHTSAQKLTPQTI